MKTIEIIDKNGVNFIEKLKSDDPSRKTKLKST